MPWPLTVVLVLVGLFVLDRLLLAAERAGWIFYRKRRPSTTGTGNALTELHAMLSPSTQNVAVAQKEPRAEHDDDGGPPDGAGRRERRG